MHFLIARYLRDDKNNATATQISERWRLAHEQYSRSVPETVRALRTLMPADWGTQTDEESWRHSMMRMKRFRIFTRPVPFVEKK
jgi:hypothetical protein